MSDSLRRLRQMRVSLEKEKNIFETEIANLRTENRAMASRLRELEEALLNERLQKLKETSSLKKQQILQKSEVSS